MGSGAQIIKIFETTYSQKASILNIDKNEYLIKEPGLEILIQIIIFSYSL